MRKHLFPLCVPHAMLLALAATLLALGASYSSPKKQQGATVQAPNILIFVADDAGWRDFGAYGNDAIRTPNIDQLAEQGLLVQRAFLTTPQCSPSRISILTGKYPHATGAEDLHMPLPEDEAILPAHLQQQGYFTGHMRKTHYGRHGKEQFQWYSQKLSSAFPNFLDEADSRPFFLWVGFQDPHRPYSEGALDTPHDPDDVEVPPYLADTPKTRQDLARYYDEIGRMDGQIGRFVEELERRGMRENTLIVFLSDNGAPFPRAKGSLYDAGTRTPLIFTWPARVEPGTRTDALTSVIDLAPTLLELAGAPLPDGIQGESRPDMILNPGSYTGREYVFSERNWHDCDEHMRSVRSDRYKLILNEDYTELPACMAADLASSPSWYELRRLREAGELTDAQRLIFEVPRPRVELYDLEADPWEIENIAGDPEGAEVAGRLAREVLGTWERETGDFPPTRRLRDDHTDRVTGVRFGSSVPPMYHLLGDQDASSEK